MNPPRRAIPRAKECTSPTKPIKVGIRPPPTSTAKGVVNATAMCLTSEDVICDKAANPAGKKQTAVSGCKNTMTAIHEREALPRSMVSAPVTKKTIIMVRRGPKRSENHPPTKAMATLDNLDKEIRVLAQVRSMACSVTR